MKKLILISIVLLTGVVSSFAQNYVVNPIPSFNYSMNDPKAYFYETNVATNTINREKRDMDVVVNTRSTSGIPTFAYVYVFRIQPYKVLGPFLAFPGVQIEVPIDNKKWGVRVDCDMAADVSVWIEE